MLVDIVITSLFGLALLEADIFPLICKQSYRKTTEYGKIKRGIICLRIRNGNLAVCQQTSWIKTVMCLYQSYQIRSEMDFLKWRNLKREDY